jgi:hypothetical protein
MAVQILEDGPRNVVVKIDDTGTNSGIAVDVSALVPACTQVRIDRVWFSCPDAGGCTLAWDATTDVTAITLNETQDFCFSEFGGLTNNAGAGVTGDVLYTGFGTGAFTVVLWCVKQGTIALEN